MPPARHRKLRRKDLKEKDEFLILPGRVWDFVTAHRTQVIASAAAACAIAVLVIAIVLYQHRQDRRAAEQFYDAFGALNTKQYELALKRFTALAQDQPRREVGRLARLYLGVCYLAKNQPGPARDALTAYLREAEDSPFKALALMDLGLTYERLGDLKRAAEAYQEATSTPGRDTSDAELMLARVLEREGDRKGAISIYQRFLGDHPFSARRQDTVESLARLGVSAQPQAASAAP